MSKRPGHPVVEPKPGANATIGTTPSAGAPRRIHALLTSPAPITNAKQQTSDLAYDPRRDLILIIHIADLPLSLIGNADFVAKDFKEFVAYARW